MRPLGGTWKVLEDRGTGRVRGHWEETLKI